MNQSNKLQELSYKDFEVDHLYIFLRSGNRLYATKFKIEQKGFESKLRLIRNVIYYNVIQRIIKTNPKEKERLFMTLAGNAKADKLEV